MPRLVCGLTPSEYVLHWRHYTFIAPGNTYYFMDKISTNNWIIIGVVAAVVILGGWWVMTSAPASSTEDGDGAEEMSDENSAPIDVTAGPSTTSDG